ncbi:MAG: TonB family protein [Deltaproteobacteria bacterium]|nr:TonB family protein [Deltaproteobacteria bacterium]
MTTFKVPLRFQIFHGDELLREEVISEPVIKVGKLPSSHLRLDDESVSRMHAVIEVNGPDDIQVIDLGSTHGTLVNGDKVARTRIKPGDEIAFGHLRVIVSYADDEATKVAAPAYAENVVPQSATPPPAYVAPPAPAPVAPPSPVAAPPRMVAPTAPIPQSAGGAPPRPPAPQYPSPPMMQPPPGFPGAGAPTGMSQMAAAASAAEIEEVGSQAVEVQSLFRGVVVNTRHLTDPSGKAHNGTGKIMTIAGAVLAVIALLTLAGASVQEGHEKDAFEKHMSEGKDPAKFVHSRGNPALDVLFFGGILVGVSLSYMGLKRWSRIEKDYVVGSSTGADAPLAPEFAGGERLALVTASGSDFVVHTTPSMQGEVYIGGQAMPLANYVQQRGQSFPLTDGARIRLDAGETRFLISSVAKPRTLPVPFLLWSWAEQKFTLAAAGVLLLFLVIIFSVPPDPKSLSLDLLNTDNRFVNFLIKPPEEKEEEIPEWLKSNKNDDQGGKGKAHKGEQGKMGKESSKNKQGLYGLKGPQDNPDPHLAKKLAEEEAKNAGILGLIKADEGSHLASLFGRDTALGSDAENVLGGLLGNQIGEAYGVGGLGMTGTGSGGGGTGEGTIGLGNLGTIGKGGGGGNGSGYGRGAGGLRGRRARAPDVIPGQAAVRGSLDKEIIRRIIRRHINEVKYCYEQELVKKPDLQGRIAVQFTIAATGQVVTSVMQTSSVGSPKVENCVVQAVRRWEFPKPKGGGIVIVSYPFVFNPAGGGDEQ